MQVVQPYPTRLKPELVEVGREPGSLVVVGDDFRARRERGLDPRLPLQAPLHRLLGQEAGGEHDRRVGGIGAAGDRGDHHRAMVQNLGRVLQHHRVRRRRFRRPFAPNPDRGRPLTRTPWPPSFPGAGLPAGSRLGSASRKERLASDRRIRSCGRRGPAMLGSTVERSSDSVSREDRLGRARRVEEPLLLHVGSTSATRSSGRPVNRRYCRVTSSTGKMAQVAPYSGDMLPMVARSASARLLRPGP